MAIDLDAFPAAVRAKLIALGQQFGSQDTLAQANQLLDAYKTYGAQVAAHGFSTGDATRVEEARDMLVEAGVGRETVRGEKAVTGLGYSGAVTEGQTVRLTARVILTGVQEDLEEAGVTKPANDVSVVLRQTRVAGDKAEELAKQLNLLSRALKATEVAAAASGRGGAEAVTKLGEAAEKLRKADQDGAGRRGTPAATQRLDLLDAIIVRLARRARKAGLAAGRALGDPALADAFKLDKLYQSRAPSPHDGEDHEGDEGDEGGEGGERGEGGAPEGE